MRPRFPFVRQRRNVALIGASTATPQSLRRAGGELGRRANRGLGPVLCRPAQKGFYRILLIHHPPLPGQADHRKALKRQLQPERHSRGTRASSWCFTATIMFTCASIWRPAIRRRSYDRRLLGSALAHKRQAACRLASLPDPAPGWRMADRGHRAELECRAPRAFETEVGIRPDQLTMLSGSASILAVNWLMSNATLAKFGDPATRLADYPHWRVLLAPRTGHAGRAHSGCKGRGAGLFSRFPSEAYAELGPGDARHRNGICGAL